MISVEVSQGLVPGYPVRLSVVVSGVQSNSVPFYPVRAGYADCTSHCAVNYTWTAGQTADGDCSTGTPPNQTPTGKCTGYSNTTCITAGEIDTTYSPPRSKCTGLDGEVVEVRWSSHESTQGVYDFSVIDNQINEWVRYASNPITTLPPLDANGVPFSIGINVEYIPDGGGGQTNPPACDSPTEASPTYEYPSYVYNDASIGQTCVSTVIKQTGQTVWYTYPNYCSADFEADLTAFLAALAEHIAQQAYSPYIQYVSIGTGVGHEAFETRNNTGYGTEPPLGTEEPGWEWEEDTNGCVDSASPSDNQAFSDYTRYTLYGNGEGVAGAAGAFRFATVYGSYNDQFYKAPDNDPGAVDLGKSFAESGFLNMGQMNQNLTPNYGGDPNPDKDPNADFSTLDQFINNPANNVPVGGIASDWARGYETDTAVCAKGNGNCSNGTNDNIQEYVQTAYCWAGGYTTAGNHRGVTVAWYANIPTEIDAGTAFNNLSSYVNSGAVPGGTDNSYCSTQLGYYS